jgi:hypothetical protein
MSSVALLPDSRPGPPSAAAADESESNIWIPQGYPPGNGLKPSDKRKDKRTPVERKGKGGGFSTAYLSDIFFYGVGEIDSDKWQCKLCEPTAQPKTQNIKCGYSNLINQHVYAQHNNWQELVTEYESMQSQVADNQNGNGSNSRANLNHFVDKISYKVFRWAELVIMLDLPIATVENPLMRSFTHIGSICSKTFTKSIELVVKALEKEIAEVLAKVPFFGLIFDGSTAKEQTHYISLFAIVPVFDYDTKYGEESNVAYFKSYAIAFSPLLDESSYTAEAHHELITETLRFYNCTWDKVAFFVADNENTNKAISDLCDKPMIGCAAHRLNLAIKGNRSQEVTNLLAKVNTLMVKLRTKKNRGKLREFTELAPKKTMPVRWSADYQMVKRYFEIEPFLDVRLFDRETALLFPTPEEQLALKMIYESFEWLDSFMRALQSPKLDLGQIRFMFDAILSKYPEFASHLQADANIVKSKHFENAVVKIVLGREHLLEEDESEVVECFKKEKWTDVSKFIDLTEEEVEQKESLNPAKMAIKRAKLASSRNSSQYIDLRWIAGVSVAAEVSFSIMNNILTPERLRLQPTTVENLMFLKLNRNLWDKFTFARALQAPREEITD